MNPDDVSNFSQTLVLMKPIGTAIFALAILHTFLVKYILHFANKFKPGSVAENLFHFLGEVEVIFGLWSAVLISIWVFRFGSASAVSYLESVNFTEASFVFVIMCIAATKPIITFARQSLDAIAYLIPGHKSVNQYFVIMTLGTILGSIITEPAAITVAAFLLKEKYFSKTTSEKFKYATIGLLFVNISIGGTLTHFAAPPVLMVAKAWGWTTPFMFSHFGIKAVVAILLSTFLTTLFFFKELRTFDIKIASRPKLLFRKNLPPIWLIASHIVFLGITVLHSHHMSFFIPLFLLFLGWTAVTAEYQDEMRLRESLLVAFFLGGLVTLGKFQDWWLQPLLSSLGDKTIFFGAIGLTAFTDNAALTYLGTLVPNLSDTTKYFLVAGAVTGGGLTVIANAPNPAAYGILQPSFGKEGISPLGLFLGALPYTILTAFIFIIGVA